VNATLCGRRVLVPAALVSLVMALSGCGRSLERQTRDQLRTLGGAELDAKAVEVTNARASGGRATADVTIRTAVTLRQQGNEWVLDEIRLGDRRWEKVDRIVQALEQARSDETRRQMDKILAGIAGYRSAHGRLPELDGFVELIDLLNPEFLDEVIRLDGWQNPFHFKQEDDGPDGKRGTDDDLVIRS
jgi:hypothetical protein